MADRWMRTSVALFDPSHDLHPMRRHEPACAAFAWQELIGLARWKDGGGLHRGQLCVSQRFLAARWMWSRDRVTRFLAELESTHRITRNNAKTSGHGQGHEPATLTICNYDAYQPTAATDKAIGKDADKDAGKDADKAKVVVSSSTKLLSRPNGRVPNGNGGYPGRGLWLAPFLDAWLRIMGGALPPKRAATALAPVRVALGGDVALACWISYLEQNKTEPKYTTPETFARTASQWSPDSVQLSSLTPAGMWDDDA